MVLVKFPFPWTLTALHALCGSIGGYVLLEQGYYVRLLFLGESTAAYRTDAGPCTNIVPGQYDAHGVQRPLHRQYRYLECFAAACHGSCMSLQPRSLLWTCLTRFQFHQVVRATTPIFTILLSVVLMGSKLHTQKLLTLLPVMAGVGFA